MLTLKVFREQLRLILFFVLVINLHVRQTETIMFSDNKDSDIVFDFHGCIHKSETSQSSNLSPISSPLQFSVMCDKNCTAVLFSDENGKMMCAPFSLDKGISRGSISDCHRGTQRKLQVWSKITQKGLGCRTDFRLPVNQLIPEEFRPGRYMTITGRIHPSPNERVVFQVMPGPDWEDGIDLGIEFRYNFKGHVNVVVVNSFDSKVFGPRQVFDNPFLVVPNKEFTMAITAEVDRFWIRVNDQVDYYHTYQSGSFTTVTHLFIFGEVDIFKVCFG